LHRRRWPYLSDAAIANHDRLVRLGGSACTVHEEHVAEGHDGRVHDDVLADVGSERVRALRRQRVGSERTESERDESERAHERLLAIPP